MGLALVMGAGVAASGVISLTREIKGAKADATPATMYLDTNKLSWYGDKSRAYLYGTGGNNGWPGQALTHETGSIYKLEVADMSKYQSVIFLRSDGTNVWNRTSKDGGTGINLPADWTTKNMFKFADEWNGNVEYDDGNYTGGWELYTPPATTYEVEVIINGVKRGDEEIGEGLLPDDPEFEYAQSWDGKWYTDEYCTEECTGVTSDVDTLYCEIVDHAYLEFTLDASRATDKFAEQYVYTWDDGGEEKAWPGTKLTSNTFYVADDAKLIINAGEGKEQTVNIDVSPVDGDTLRILNSTDGGKYEAIWESEIDEPDVEGYYICGEFSSNPCWTYDNAEQMTNTTGENVAYEMNFLLAVGDELRVRSFYTDRLPYDQWATLGDNGYADPTDGWGVKSGDNFKATKAGYYDIYAKYEDRDENPDDKESFMFYVAPHVDSYEISLTAKIYDGRTLVDTRNLASQLAYDGSNFNPVFDTIEGYTSYGVFTDAACSTEYEPHAFSAAGQLYLKYMRTGYYVVGDADFTGSNIGAWAPNGGVRLKTECQDPANFLEGAIIIPDAEEAVQTRPLLLNNDGTTEWVDYSLGGTYSFASKNGDNIEFSEAGTYGVYVKIEADQAVVYLNKGLEAFYTKFLGEVGGVCSEILGGTKDLDNLKTVWLSQKAAYESLSATEKATISGITGGIDGGDEEGDRLHQVVAKYSYIVHKYGTANCEDFIWNGTYAPSSSNGIRVLNINSNVLVITLVSVSVTLVSAGLVFLLIRRRRLVK